MSSKAPRVTDKTLNTILGPTEDPKLRSGAPWYAGESMPMTKADEIARAARENFVKWIDWYLVAFPTETGGEPGGKGSQEQLAKKLGITAPAISAWRRKGSDTYPNMKNLIRFYLLVKASWGGFHFEMLLFSDTPPQPRR